MKNIRIGNDIAVAWRILKEGVPFSLEGKDVRIYLRSPFSKTEVKDFSVEGYKVVWTFFGKDQKNVGKYSLELVINEDAEGMITTDVCHFVNLVSCSCKTGGADEGNVQTESIELTSNLEYVAGSGEGGGGSYDDTAVKAELARLEKDKADKSELTELSAEIGNKQDTITDLETIRSGAAKGATALQSVPDTYATKTYVDNKIAEEIDNALTEEY